MGILSHCLLSSIRTSAVVVVCPIVWTPAASKFQVHRSAYRFIPGCVRIRRLAKSIFSLSLQSSVFSFL
jgi:hypothetical protein